MATTPNYGWATPNDSDPFKNGASAIRTLGNAIDSTLFNFINIKQIVTASYATSTSNSTNVAADTGLTATITPSSVNSKILILLNQAGCAKSAGNAANSIRINLLRGASIITYPAVTGAFTNSALVNQISVSCVYLDSPATTSATTYKTQFLNNANAASVTVQQDSALSNIILVELEF